MVEEFLDRLERLGALDDTERAELARTCSATRLVDADTDLACEGDQPDHLHVLLDGWACRFVLLPDGRRQIPALLLPGDVADLDALGVERLDYGIATLTPCRVALLSRPALRSAMGRLPGLARAFLALALQENAVMLRRNVSLGRLSAREQVAHLLCELVSRMAADGEASTAGKHSMPLTQVELADVLGLSPVHVNRVLQSLRADKLLRLAGRRLEILDWAGLAAAGSFRATYLEPAHPRTVRSVMNGAASRLLVPSHA